MTFYGTWFDLVDTVFFQLVDGKCNYPPLFISMMVVYYVLDNSLRLSSQGNKSQLVSLQFQDVTSQQEDETFRNHLTIQEQTHHVSASPGARGAGTACAEQPRGGGRAR